MKWNRNMVGSALTIGGLLLIQPAMADDAGAGAATTAETGTGDIRSGMNDDGTMGSGRTGSGSTGTMNPSSPATGDSSTGGAQAHETLFTRADTDRNGELSREEFEGLTESAAEPTAQSARPEVRDATTLDSFDEMDEDGNGAVSPKEFFGTVHKP